MYQSIPVFLFFFTLYATASHSTPNRLGQDSHNRSRKVKLNSHTKHRFSGNVTLDDNLGRLQKRGYSGKATFFTPGLGACGVKNTESDFIVALNQDQYGSSSSVSSWCFKTIEITYGSKSHTAEITDCCPGCNSGDLDMSPALFDYFANPDVGVFYMNWDVADGGSDSGDDTTTTTTKKTTTTTTDQSTTTTTTTTTTSTVTTTTSLTTTTTANSTSTSLSSSTSLNSTSTVANMTSTSTTTTATTTTTSLLPTPTIDPNFQTGVLNNLNQVYLGIGGLLAGFAVQANGH